MAVAAPIDFTARYAVEGCEGVAFYLLGYVERDTPDTEWDGVREVDTDWVVGVMVGDDRRHEIEVCDLVPLADGDYCASCGQIGCGHDGRERD